MVKKHAGYLIAAALILVLLISVSIPLVSAFQNPVQDTSVGEPFEPNYRNFVNNAFQSVASTFSGPSAPPNPYVGQLWYNSTSGATTQWNGSSWVAFGGGGGGSGCTSVGANGVLQTSNGSGGCSAFGGNSTLGAHLFAKSQDASGNFIGGQPSDQDISFSDNTVGNVSTGSHGYAPKLPGTNGVFLDGTGAWSTPAGSSGGGLLDARAGNPLTSQVAALNTQYTLYTFTVPGGTLGNAGAVKIDAGLTYTNTTSVDTPSIGISYGGATLLQPLPVSVAIGSNTGISLECTINALGGPGVQSTRCKLSFGNGTGAFNMYNFTLTQASGSNQALTILYNDTSSGNSIINLLSATVNTGPGGGAVASSACPPGYACPETFGALGNGTTIVDTTPTPNIKTYGNSAAPMANPLDTTVSNELVITVLGDGANGAITPPGTPASRVNIAGTASTFGLYVGDQTISSISQTSAQTGSATSAIWTSASIGIPPSGASTVTFGAVSSSSVAASNAITLSVPAGSAAGDTLLGVIISYSTFVPAGTAVSSFIALHNTGAISGQANVYLYYRTMQVGDTSFVVNSDVNTGHAYALVDYKNAGIPDNGISSVAANFKGADVNKIACMDQTSATLDSQGFADDLCGTISAVVNSHLITPSFNSSIHNGYGPALTANGLTSSGAEFDYATDDCASGNAIQATVNSLVQSGTAGQPTATGGGTILVSKRYGCLPTEAPVIPNNVTVNIHGLGSGLTRWGFSSTGNFNVSNNYNSSTATGLMILGHGSGGALQLNSGATGAPYANMTHDVWDNFSVWAGAGFHWGSGSTGPGIVGTDVVRFRLQDVTVGNFGGPCVLFNAAGNSGPTDYDTIVEVRDNYLTGCNYGVEIDNSTNTSATMQDFVFDTNEIENNLLNAVYETSGSTIYGITFQGSNISQRDNVSQTANQHEIELDGTLNGCTMLGTYFEKDSGNLAGFISDGNQCNRMGEASASASANKGIVARSLLLNGHLQASSTIPTITASGGTCGTTDSVTAGSTDVSGEFETGTTGGVSSCVITFSTAFTSAPIGCMVEDRTGGSVPVFATAPGTLTVTTSANSHFIRWWCPGPQA